MIANSGNLICNANNGGGNFNGLGLAIIGWNNSNGGAEVDFVNGFTGFANPNSFTWYQVLNSTTTKVLANLTSGGNLGLDGIGVVYGGVAGGGNAFGFAWSGNIETFVDGNHVATLAGQQWVINNYLALTGGTLSGDLTLTSGRSLWLQNVSTNTGQIYSNVNFGTVVLGLSGNIGDVCLSSRSANAELRILYNGTVYLNGATVDASGQMLLVADPTAGLGAVTKQYVDTHVAGGVTSFNTRTGAVTLSYADVTGVLPPSATTPVMDGTATAGIANAFSRGDHVHPHDSSKFDVAGGTINGSVQVNGTNLTLGNPTISYTRISVWAQEATAPGYAWYTANNLKWLLAMDQYQESTNNSAQGGNLAFYRYNDDGSFLGTVFTLGRSDGSANFGGPVMLAADPTANLGAATKQYVDTGLGRYLPLAGGSMSGSIAMASYVPISFNSAAATIAATSADAASILGCNFTLNSWNGIGFGPQINYSPFVPVGMYGVAIDTRFGNLAVHGLITASDSRINANNWLQTLRIYRPTGGTDQTIEISANTYTPALASTTPVAGGAGNAVNDRLYDAQGNFYTVTAVSGGAVTTIQMDSCRAVSGLPANPVALTACSGFNGTGVTVNLTWTVPQRLVLQHLAGAVTLYGTGGLQLNGGTPGTTLYGPATFVNHATFQAGIDTNRTSPAMVRRTRQAASRCGGAAQASYGFAITSSTLNYNTVAGQHNFYSSASLAMSIANNAGSQNISYLPLVANSTFTATGISYLQGAAYFTGANPQINIDGPAQTWRTLQWYSSGSARWNIQVNVDAETGGNVGSDLLITRWNDAGSAPEAAVKVQRSTGRTFFQPSFADPVEISVGSTLSARYRSTVSTIRTWSFGTQTDGGFKIGDETSGNYRLTIDTVGNTDLNGTLTVESHTTVKGGISFNDQFGSDPYAAMTAFGINMFGGQYGFSITGGTLNLNSGGVINFNPSVGGAIASVSTSGIGLASSTTVTLGRDPTAALEAATMQYVNAKVSSATGGGSVSTPSANVVLTAASPRAQSITFSAPYLSVTLPAATTMSPGGPVFSIYNNGAYTFALRRNDGTLLTAVPSGATAEVYLDGNSTAAGNWHATGSGLLPAFETQSVLMTGAVSTANTVLLGLIGTTAIYCDGAHALAGYDTVANVFGSTISLPSGGTVNATFLMPLSATQGLIVYGQGALNAVVLTVASGAVLSLGTQVAITAGAIQQPNQVVALTATSFLAAYSTSVPSSSVVVVTVSGTTATFGTPVVFCTNQAFANSTILGGLLALSATSAIGVTTAAGPQVAAISISGTTVTVGTLQSAVVGNPLTSMTILSATAVAILGINTVVVASVSGTTLTIGAQGSLGSNYATYKVFSLSPTSFVAVVAITQTQGALIYCTFSGVTITVVSNTGFAGAFQLSSGSAISAMGGTAMIAPGYLFIPNHGVVTQAGGVWTLVQPDPWPDHLATNVNQLDPIIMLDGAGGFMQFLMSGSNYIGELGTGVMMNNILGKPGVVSLFGALGDFTYVRMGCAISPGRFLVATMVPGKIDVATSGLSSNRLAVWQLAA